MTLAGWPKLVISSFFFLFSLTDVVVTVRCHNYDLDSPLDRETGLDIFKVDPEYEQHEAEYQVGCVSRILHVFALSLLCCAYQQANDLLNASTVTCYPPVECSRRLERLQHLQCYAMLPLTFFGSCRQYSL